MTIAARAIRSPIRSAIYSPRGISAAGWLLDGEVAGLSLSYAEGNPSAAVKGHTTYFDGEPNDLLTYTSPSTKYVRSASGILVPGATLRTDHSAAGMPLGLRIEGQRTNLALYSEAQTNAAYAKTLGTVSGSSAAGPDGATTLCKFILDSGTVNGYVEQSVSVTSGVQYTFSVFTRAAEYTSGTLLVVQGSNPQARFDLSAGTIAEVNSPDDSGIENWGGGLFRVWVTVTASATASRLFRFYDRNPGARAGNGTSGIHTGFWVVEAAASPSSYIKTEGSQVTRAADDITIPQASFPWNSGTGTLTLNGSAVTPVTDGTDLDIAGTCVAEGVEWLETLTWVPL